MTPRAVLPFEKSEQFPRLPRAPIVEAVIHWRARSAAGLQDDLQELRAKLPEYPTVQQQHELQLAAEIRPNRTAHTQAAEWHGFRFESGDARNIAQFTRNGFVFSRIAPYENWERFAAEAKRLWQVHVEFARPSEIERLGVRFINRIVPIDLAALDKILASPPRAPAALELPIGEFMHRSLLTVPGHPYHVNVILASQPPTPPETDALGLILDVDVSTTTSMELDTKMLDARLAEMRWLKNRAFFSLLTPQAVARFAEKTP